MNTIHVLDKHVAELIAAGEVIDRPCSVIKELTENAVDAGATAVTVEIQNGGIRYMRVTDDGCGIRKDDVPTAFIRHATSKIQTEDDLNCIGTFGFRGEALPSVAAMARVEMLTRAKGEDIGCKYLIDGGEEKFFDDAGCPEGTTIIVRDLFYNTPARMKFLKKDVAEGNAVAAVIDRLALAEPNVSVRFIRDGKLVLHTPGNGDAYATAYAVFGREVAQTLVPVDYSMGEMAVKGFVSKPAFARSSRSLQYFYVNSRYVKTKTAMAAVEEACKGSIMVGKYPACILNITMPLNAVDVNVHPAKIEVRFVNERPVFDCVYAAVKSVIESVTEKKEFAIRNVSSSVNPFTLHTVPEEEQQTLPPNYRPYTLRAPQASAFDSVSLRTPIAATESEPSSPVFEPVPLPNFRETTPAAVSAPAPDLASLPSAPAPEPSPAPAAVEEAPAPTPAVSENKEEPPVSMRVIGELFSTYILAESGNSLILIDKHAAHERLIYEKIRRENDGVSRQLLLTPVILPLSKENHAAVCANTDIFKKAGFLVEDFGSFSIAVREIPVVLQESDIESVVCEIADSIVKKRHTDRFDYLDNLYHSIACRSAIKANDKSALCELQRLVCDLLAHPDVRYCPHGRPIYIQITKRELEKQFGRIQ